MLENAVGEGICGGGREIVGILGDGREESETPSLQPAGTWALLSYYANLFDFNDCDLGHNFD
jgi:hypothetical protein